MSSDEVRGKQRMNLSLTGQHFGQRRPPLSVTIKAILERYPDGQIFKVCLFKRTKHNCSTTKINLVHGYFSLCAWNTTSWANKESTCIIVQYCYTSLLSHINRFKHKRSPFDCMCPLKLTHSWGALEHEKVEFVLESVEGREASSIRACTLSTSVLVAS